MENFTLYHKNGEFKSLGWTVNNSILKNTIAESLYIPAGLLYINDNLKKEKINSYDNGVVNSFPISEKSWSDLGQMNQYLNYISEFTNDEKETTNCN